MEWTALAIAGVGVLTVATQLFLQYLSTISHIREREEDFARRALAEERTIEIARQAEKSASLLSAAQQTTIKKTDEIAAKAKEATAETRSQLTRIHTLVNGKLTASLQAALDLNRSNLVFLHRLEHLGHATAEDLALADETAKRIVALESELADRARQEAEEST